MKNLDLDTVGGRIRKIRQDANLSMQVFAKKFNITGNYVGLIERGDRTPSPELIRKISSAMGVPHGWLAKGSPHSLQDLEINVRKDVDDAESDPAQAVNPQLYLSIVLAMAPNISKDTLETILGVPSETIDGLLAGIPYEYDPHWANAYSVLTRSLDLHTLRRDLRRLDIFLEREETVKYNTAMLRALRRYAEKSMKQQPKTLSINAQSPETVPLHVRYTDIILSSEGSPSTWYFKYFPEQEDTDYFYPSDVFDDAVALADQIGYKVSIVLTSEDEYNSMCRYCERMEVDDEGRAMMDIPCALPPDVSLIHFDRETEQIVEWEFPEPKFDV